MDEALWKTLMGLLLVSGILGHEPYDYEQFQEFVTTESERGLFPNIFNLATNSLISASATCGQTHREEYCKLVEHVLLRKTTSGSSPQCDICDANDVHHRHPIEFAIDGTRRWWQSPSLANGLEYEKVNITIDLRQEYQVAYIVIKMGNSPRPGTWALEKSLDGENWTAWQFYATSDAECMRQFGVPATTGVPRFQRDDEVHCTSEYSKLTPLEAGEIHTSLVNGRPGAEKPSLELQKFTRTRFLRLRLISPRTLNADLMIINRHSHRIDKSVTMRYFYSISDVSIGGQCICYGHAESCPSDAVTGQFKCECRHNTCGESCNKCCPLFNQLLWKPGTNSHPNICQQCQCFNHAEDCVYDEELDRNKWSITPEGVYEGGGRCIDCQHNTEGFNCERCKDGYFRASGLSHYREDACRPCDCDPVGSVSEVCVKDDQTAAHSQHPGDCVCKPGFGGRRCDRCARGFRHHPRCEPCPCNQHGSLNFDTCDEAKCQCKANVEGLYCDRCRAGTINLQASNPMGCQPCFCFGLTSNCTQVDWATSLLSNNKDWNLTDLTGGKDIRPETENGEVLLFNANQNQDRSLYYWKAPKTFNGNLLNSYGGNLHYFVYFVPEAQGNAVPVADVVIEGNGIKLEYYSRIEFFPRENMTVQIPISEGSGWYNSETRTPVEKTDLMRALANVERLLVRAMYQQQQLQSSIFGLTLDTAIEPDDYDDEEDVLQPNAPVLMRGVEVCQCPENIAGNSCESCAPGFRRVNNHLYLGQCVKCECNGHSEQCNPYTGACMDCRDNTRGDRCEMCLPGHYGNPLLGGEDPMGTCEPCECPTLENNRSPECVMTELVLSLAASKDFEDEYVCTACETGYEGNKCETCADGFFGDPLAINGSCTECKCNGNIDPMAIGNCDRTTGKCLKCIGETTGESCETCKEYHWGSALGHSCKSCDCHAQGSETPQCSEIDGRCKCKESYIGPQCDRCEDGHGDVENGCPACDCDVIGSIGDQCDAVSGQCSCKQGVFGKRCDQCLASYYNFSVNGCQFCHCNIYGSIEDGKCDSVTGECECRDNVEGTMCEKCASGFFNISSGLGCQECLCDTIGAVDETCDLVSGQCNCKPGVVGAKCDSCQANHFGLDDEGCQECEPCPAPGQVCDQDTGDCVCPQNTVGEICEECAENAWDYHPLKGCKTCDCSKIGSLSGKCNANTGQCECKESFVGLRCDLCSHGYFNFPQCESCNCNVDGTDPLQCKDGLCLCDEKGQCPCKKNVQGEKCDQCKANTFSLDVSSPLGCTDCFCFNRSTSCIQASLVWRQIYAEDRHATFEEPWVYYTKKHNLNILPDSPSTFNSYPTDATPVYWSLPKTMLGDRTGSYNAFLRFKIWNEDNRRGIHGLRPDLQYFRYFPQVVLVGNNRLELEHVPMEINDDGKYKIRLHESAWRLRQSPEIPLSRKTLMVALQNLQGIFIRASYNYPARGDAIVLQEVSLDVSVSKEDSMTSSAALGVEKCLECPQGYAGSSCQDPAEGYCRKRHRDYLNQPDELSLLGWSEPCACNGHSTKCHPETCVCQDCEHNAIGDFCELCKPGFIGDAREGGATACTKCACPSIDNSFSDSCVAVNYGRGYVCNNCKRGHTGQYCETCAAGFFGDPAVVDGFCEECACHPDGSLHGKCHLITGECECRPGVTGRDCSRCQERHAFIAGVCTSCDQGCYEPLMTSVDELEIILHAQNFSNLKPIPWKRLNRIHNNTQLILEFVGELSTSENEGDVENIVKDSKYAKEAVRVIEEARFQMDRMEKSAQSLELFTEMVQELTNLTQQKYSKAFNTTQFLVHFYTHGGSSIGGATLDAWMMEADAHLEASRERGDYIQKRLDRAEAEHLKNQQLLKKVFANKLNDTAFENLLRRNDEMEQWLEDYRITVYDNARKDTSEAERMSDVVVRRVDRYKEVRNEIERMDESAKQELLTATEGVELAKGMELLNMFDDAAIINETLEETFENKDKCRQIAHKIAQVVDEYDEKLVQPAVERSKELEAEAAQLQNKFKQGVSAETEAPLKAVGAYDGIVGAMKNASDAANTAVKAAKEALKMGLSTFEVDELTQMSQITTSQKDSSAIAETLAELSKEWESLGLSAEQKMLDDRLSAVHELNIDVIKRKDNIRTQWGKFDDHHDRMAGLQGLAREADRKAEDARKGAETLAAEVLEIEEETNRLENSTRKEIQEDVVKIKEVRLNLEEGKKMLINSEGSSLSTIKRSENIERQLSLLKNRINEAREKAQMIRLSVKGDERGKCRRSYISPASAAPTNSLRLSYRPARSVPDSAILVTKTKNKRTQATEYIALEIREKRVIVHWNIGSGAKKATNSHPINYIPSNELKSWYEIDVLRTGDSVNLTVSLRDLLQGQGSRSKSEAVSVVVGTDSIDNDVIFNTIPDETLLQLGCEESQKTEIGLSTADFHGIMGRLTVDEKPVSLWEFASTTLQCDGHAAPPETPHRGHFFRDGFAEVVIQVQERIRSALTVSFSTFSQDGLLYFRGSQHSGDFLSLHLHEGHVIFTFDVGGKNSQSIKSIGNYNDGKEHTAKAIRNGGEIHLQVDSEADRQSSTLNAEQTALNIEHDTHYVAGVPQGLDIARFAARGVQFKGFHGCILTVKPSQISDLDLEHPKRSLRREPGCHFEENRLSPNDRMISFPRPGFLLNRGISLDTKSTFGFSFRTKEENGTLVFQSSRLTSNKRYQREAETEGMGYMAFYLFRGYLVLHLGKDSSARNQVVTMRSTAMYNDGHLHTVFLSRTGKKIRVRVDDKDMGDEGKLEVDTAIGSSDSQMFLGGFPEGTTPLNTEIPSTIPLIGCIGGVFHNYKRIEFVPEFHSGRIGQCNVQSSDETLVASEEHHTGIPSRQTISRISHPLNNTYYEVIPSMDSITTKTTISDDQCSASLVSSLEGVRFGISKSSHSRVNFMSGTHPNITSFSVSMSIRTEKDNGMVWVWANYKNYTRYFYFNIIDGFATIEMKGHRQPKILKATERKLNDGQWHDVEIRKKDKTLSLLIDELAPLVMNDCPTPKVMRRRMYVGGVISKHRTQFGLDIPGFNGCIKEFRVNSALKTLDGESSRDLIPCTRPNKGIYAHEGGHAVFDMSKQQWKEDEVDISIELKPLGSEGLILGILSNARPHATRITIEVQFDKLLVTLVDVASKLEVRDAIPTLRSFCNGKWHYLALKINTNTVHIHVDGERTEIPVSIDEKVMDRFRHLPLNIAGLSAPTSESLSTRSLTGCYRQLKIAAEQRFFHKADKTNKVLLDACPYA